MGSVYMHIYITRNIRYHIHVFMWNCLCDYRSWPVSKSAVNRLETQACGTVVPPYRESHFPQIQLPMGKWGQEGSKNIKWEFHKQFIGCAALWVVWWNLWPLALSLLGSPTMNFVCPLFSHWHHHGSVIQDRQDHHQSRWFSSDVSGQW